MNTYDIHCVKQFFSLNQFFHCTLKSGKPAIFNFVIRYLIRLKISVSKNYHIIMNTYDIHCVKQFFSLNQFFHCTLKSGKPAIFNFVIRYLIRLKISVSKNYHIIMNTYDSVPGYYLCNLYSISSIAKF